VLVGSRAGGFHSRAIEVLDRRGVADRFLAEGQTAQAAMIATRWLPGSGHHDGSSAGVRADVIHTRSRIPLAGPGDTDDFECHRTGGSTGEVDGRVSFALRETGVAFDICSA
jgi:hypothetical protein